MILFHDSRARLFAGAILISFSPVFVALVGVSPTVSAFYRVLIGGTALGLYWLLRSRSSGVRGLSLAALGGAAIFFALDLWFWHRSILAIGPGRSTLLANLQVFFMMAAGAAFLHHRPTARQLLAACIAIAGLAMMIGPDWMVPAENYRAGVILGILTAASYTGYLLLLRAARMQAATASPAREVTVVSLLAAVALGLCAWAEGRSFAVASAADLGWLLGYGLLAHAGGVVLIAGSLSRVTPSDAGIALLLQPALSFLWDILFFGGQVTMFEAAGVVVTLAAIYLGTARPPPRRV